MFNKKETIFQDYARVLFKASFPFFVILFVVEYALPGAVVSFFNPIWILIIAIISGIIATIKE